MGHGKVPIAAPIGGVGCLSYDYIDLTYLSHDFGNSPFLLDGQGYGVDFSKSLGSNFYISAGYTHSDYEVDLTGFGANTDAETDRYRLGLGLHFPIFHCVDWVLEGGATHTDVSYARYSALDNDRWGWYGGTGFRAMVGANLEAYGLAYYHDEEGYDSWRITPGLVWQVHQAIGLKVGGEFYENDQRALVLGARFNY